MSRTLVRSRLSTVLAVLALAVAGVAAAAGPAAADDHGHGLTCRSGTIHSGTYSWLTVTGDCSIPNNAHVVVTGDLRVDEHAMLNKFTPDLANFNMASVHVYGDVVVERGAILGLGCSVAMANDPMMPFPFCSKTRNSDVLIRGNLVAQSPLTMYLDGIHVRGNLASYGGGPGPKVTMTNPAFNFPIKDDRVDGNLIIKGWNGGWVGIIRDVVGHDVVYSRNQGVDPDANEVITNQIRGDLSCWLNEPAAQYGDAAQVPGAAPNKVGDSAVGQCRPLTKPF